MKYFSLFLKKTLRYVLKPLSFLPALCMLYLIFYMSSQNGESSGSMSYELSKVIVLAYNKILSKGYPNEILNQLIGQIHPFIRKTAHFTEFFCLAITITFPLYVYRLRGILLFLTSQIFCVIVAFLDEYSQSFVLGRTPAFRDVMIDSAGAVCGIFIAHFLCYLGRKTIFHFLSMEDYQKKKRDYEIIKAYEELQKERQNDDFLQETSSQNKTNHNF